MNYQDTISYLFNALPIYQEEGKSAYKANLDNTYALMEALDNPHKKFKSIHIAGTNGKGSVSHMLAAIFQKCGYKTGLYTSPHLLDFRERILINGEMISEEKVTHFVEEQKANFKTIQPSFFEMTVALAFKTFAEEKVDIAIIETGLGGRLDSTNIISPEVSVITNISKDHAQILGHTLEEIAGEKAGIIKEGTPVVLGDTYPHLNAIFEKKAKELKAKIYLSPKSYKTVTQKTNKDKNNITYNHQGKYFTLITDMMGYYQAGNIATVLTTVDLINKITDFKIPDDNCDYALGKVKEITGLRGRWDTLQKMPLCIADTGHNEAGINFLMEQIKDLPHKRKFIIYGCVEDKEISDIFPLFDQSFTYIFTKSSNKRSMNEEILLKAGKEHRLTCQSTENIKAAIAEIKKTLTKEDVIIICGSTFLVAEALPLFKKRSSTLNSSHKKIN